MISPTLSPRWEQLCWAEIPLVYLEVVEQLTKAQSEVLEGEEVEGYLHLMEVEAEVAVVVAAAEAPS